MRRRAIISDIHGNLPALEAVLADIATQKVDEIVCLGDVCGYGPQPLECIALLREKCVWMLLGNHDEAIFKEPLGFSSNAYDAIKWQRKLLDPAHGAPDTAEVRERLEWLKNLTPGRKEGAVTYVHAAPRDPLHEYVLKEDYDSRMGGPSPAAKANFELIEELCFCGHSHRPGVVAEDYLWHTPEDLGDGRYVLRPGFKTLVNAGSVGQPRDKHPEACYVLYDTPKQSAPSSPPAPLAATQVQPAAVPANGDTHTLVLPRAANERRPSGISQISHPELLSPDKKLSAEAAALTETQRVELVERVDEETRTETDPVMQKARDTVLLRMPKINFRRVPYDVAETSRRIFAIPELPKYNAILLAKGL